MKHLLPLVLVLSLPSYPTPAAPVPMRHQSQAGPRAGRLIILRRSDAPRTVPVGWWWRVQGLAPYVAERGIGTADLYVKGQVQLGAGRAYTVNGDFDLTINKRQTLPLWVLGGSKVSVGDSRARVVFTEERSR